MRNLWRKIQEDIFHRATVYTGCFNCDYETEFHGKINKFDTASFQCPNCKDTFTFHDWSSFFDEVIEL